MAVYFSPRSYDDDDDGVDNDDDDDDNDVDDGTTLAKNIRPPTPLNISP